MKLPIRNRLVCCILTLAFICAEQLARCWTRSCCRWPRCWTRRQMNLRSPQETRYSLTPSLIYWSYSKHLLLLPVLLTFSFYILWCISSYCVFIVVVVVANSDCSPTLALNFTRFRRDGTWRGYCTPSRRLAGGGWRRTARLIPLLFEKVSSLLRFSPRQGRLDASFGSSPPWAQIPYNFVCCFPGSRYSRPSCAVTWRWGSRVILSKQDNI